MATKNVLITAGPTWVAIDSVRVISNSASGETGILLAHEFLKRGIDVTLMLGPTVTCCIDKGIKVIPFKFFEEFRTRFLREIRSKKHDVVIQSAAVSDYKPENKCSNKVSSGKRNWRIKLIPTEKLINKVKEIDPDAFLVGFKFEPQTTKSKLLQESANLIKQSKADLVVANTIKSKEYSALIVGPEKIYCQVSSKEKVAKNLVNIIGKRK